MEKILLASALFTWATLALQAQQSFTIKEKFSEVKQPHKITLRYSTGGKTISDTTTMVNGAFSFRGPVQFPVKASLYLVPLRLETQAEI